MNLPIQQGVARVGGLYAGLLLAILLTKILLFLWLGLPPIVVSLLLWAEAACMAWLALSGVCGRGSHHSRISLVALFVLWLAGAVSYWSGSLPAPILEALVLAGCAAARLLVAIPLVIWPVMPD